ncbi:hypothetical protein OK016_28165 [Vibrio chagasii]|nr:hypothetical protein [Vibrio chagasii]
MVKQNCGNILAGVAPFAIERGLVRKSKRVTPRFASSWRTRSRKVATVTVQTPNKQSDLCW